MTYVKVGRVLSSLFLLKEQWEGYSWRDPAYCDIQSFPQTWEGTSCDVSACCNLLPTRVETRSWREGSSHLVIPQCAFPPPHSQASLLFFSTLIVLRSRLGMRKAFAHRSHSTWKVVTGTLSPRASSSSFRVDNWRETIQKWVTMFKSKDVQGTCCLVWCSNADPWPKMSIRADSPVEEDLVLLGW